MEKMLNECEEAYAIRMITDSNDKSIGITKNRYIASPYSFITWKGPENVRRTTYNNNSRIIAKEYYVSIRDFYNNPQYWKSAIDIVSTILIYKAQFISITALQSDLDKSDEWYLLHDVANKLNYEDATYDLQANLKKAVTLKYKDTVVPQRVNDEILSLFIYQDVKISNNEVNRRIAYILAQLRYQVPAMIAEEKKRFEAMHKLKVI